MLGLRNCTGSPGLSDRLSSCGAIKINADFLSFLLFIVKEPLARSVPLPHPCSSAEDGFLWKKILFSRKGINSPRPRSQCLRTGPQVSDVPFRWLVLAGGPSGRPSGSSCRVGSRPPVCCQTSGESPESPTTVYNTSSPSKAAQFGTVPMGKLLFSHVAPGGRQDQTLSLQLRHISDELAV